MRRQRLVCSVAGLIGFCVFSYVVLYLSSMASNKYIPGNSLAPKYFMERISRLRYKRSQLYQPMLQQEMEEKCSTLSDHHKLIDADCRALWEYKLTNSPVTKVDRLWGFKHTHWGAITLTLNSTMTALFKPCSTVDEDVRREIIGAHLDYILEFGQNAPVVSRRIPIDVFDKLIRSQRSKEILAETIEKCSVGDYLEGVMIGWRESLRSIKTQKKTKYSLPYLYENRIALGSDLFKAQTVSRFHTFYWLIGILRWGKDEFITPTGDLVSLDLDRSNYEYTIDPRSSTLNFTWCFTCYMDKKTYDTFYEIHHSKYPLSKLMRVSLQDENIFHPLYTRTLGKNLDIRIEKILECMTDCTKVYKKENVLLQEPQKEIEQILESFQHPIEPQ